MDKNLRKGVIVFHDDSKEQVECFAKCGSTYNIKCQSKLYLIDGCRDDDCEIEIRYKDELNNIHKTEYIIGASYEVTNADDGFLSIRRLYSDKIKRIEVF